MSTPVEKIKERLSIEEVVGSYIKLEKAGKNLKAKCPFHNEKTASFYVSPDRGSFYCFGCGAKGDIFSFVEQFEGLDFMGTLKLLGERAGIPIVFERGETKSEKERLYTIMEEATNFFEYGLSQSKEAKEYLKKRGLNEETIKSFRIGFIPNEWRLLYNNLKNKGYSENEIEKAGLGKRPEAGENGLQKTIYDRFRGRIMFPIMDSSGRVIAFSGRILVDDGKSAKYLNSPDTILFNKSTVLYGIDKAKQDIRSKNYSILVEGQMDLVLSHQAGIKNTVAVSGTALSDTLTSRENVINNLGVIYRLSKNIILAFDSDNAGRKAAMRSAQIALSLGMDVKIADLKEGKDPADLVLEDREEWKNVLRKAKPVIEFQIDSVLREAEQKNINLRKIPELIREKVLPFILALEGAMEKSHYIKMIHEKTQISEDAIREDLKKIMHNAPRQDTISGGKIVGIAQVPRLENISRKLFGLLAYIEERANTKKDIDTDGIYAAIKRIAGEDIYNNLIKEVEPFKNELILETEILFGHNKEIKDIVRYKDELLLNLEEDVLRKDLSDAMAEITKLEAEVDSKDKDHERKKLDIMKKCQILASRLGEIRIKRK